MASPVDTFWRTLYRVGYKLALCWWFVRRPHCRGAYVAVWVDDSLLIIRNSYRNVYTLPCGGVDPGETPLEAGVRELREETGIAVEAEQLKTAGRFTGHTEYKHDHSEVFEVHLDERPSVIPDNREVISAEFHSAAVAIDLPLSDIARQYMDQRSGQ